MKKGCIECKHINPNKTKDDRTNCKAFPNGIPFEILFGGWAHTKKHPDQKNNILFEKVNDNKS